MSQGKGGGGAGMCRPVIKHLGDRSRVGGLLPPTLSSPSQAKGNPESSFNDENLRLVVADLFSAGMITTSTTLAWALLLMILHPDVQREPRPGG